MTKQRLVNQQSPPSTSTLLINIWGHLSHRRRFQMGVLLLVMLASGGAELLSLGAVLPYLAVISNPESLWQQPLVQDIADWLGLTSATQLLLPATLAFATASVLAALIRLSNLWLNNRLAAAVGSDLSCEAYRRTLYQPYELHLQRNSIKVMTSITTHVGGTVAGLNSLLQIFTAFIVAVGLLTGLLLIDAPAALSAAMLFGTAYGALGFAARHELQNNGKKIAVASEQQLKASQEGLGAIRDVLLDGTQEAYLQIYQKADRPLRKFKAKNTFLAAFPRYALEALGMVAIAIFGGILVMQRGSGSNVIPILGALALGAQRLMPALQQIYSGWAALKSYHAAIQDVLDLLNQPLPQVVIQSQPLILQKSILLSGVGFRYTPESRDILNSFDLEICYGERIGIIGSTGSGKSTTIDLIMGLLKPTFGQILVDGVDLHASENFELLAAWRSSVAHVPQNIYLADCSIAENIAFGLSGDKIDLNKVRQAANQAQIHNFIESMPHGYDCFVGERGIRLSGGQRQRIGIARALYKQAQILVFDEATSALDNETEQAVMDAIGKLREDLTIVIVAHRLSTINKCDRVIKLVNGTVIADGPPEFVLSHQ